MEITGDNAKGHFCGVVAMRVGSLGTKGEEVETVTINAERSRCDRDGNSELLVMGEAESETDPNGGREQSTLDFVSTLTGMT